MLYLAAVVGILVLIEIGLAVYYMGSWNACLDDFFGKRDMQHD